MDSERGRDSRRKKYSSKDKEKEPTKKMVILVKTKESKQEEVPPTIILKTRDNERAISPQMTTAKCSSKDSEPSQSYHLAPKPNSGNPSAAVPSPPQMQESLKLLDDDTLNINDSILDFLTDTSDFLVVGCVGLQGVGKSTIMSHLANPASINNPDLMMFKSQNRSHVETNSHCTEGIQCYVTDKRVIFLDVQPILSLSVLSKYYASEGAALAVRSCHRDDPDYPSMENDLEILFLQYLAFVMSICHVIIVVQDYFYDPDLIKSLQMAELLKPPTSNHADEEKHEHFPHCVLVHNRWSQKNFSCSKVKVMQEHYKAIFSHSQINIESGMGMANGVFMPSLSPELCEGPPINLFLLPNRSASENSIKYEVKEYEEIIQLMRSHIFGVPVTPLTHMSLTEKNWFHFAVKVWEDIKKNSMFSEYGRMLPTASSYKVEQ